MFFKIAFVVVFLEFSKKKTPLGSSSHVDLVSIFRRLRPQEEEKNLPFSIFQKNIIKNSWSWQEWNIYFFTLSVVFVSIFDGMNYFLSKVNAEKLVSST